MAPKPSKNRNVSKTLPASANKVVAQPVKPAEPKRKTGKPRNEYLGPKDRTDAQDTPQTAKVFQEASSASGPQKYNTRSRSALPTETNNDVAENQDKEPESSPQAPGAPESEEYPIIILPGVDEEIAKIRGAKTRNRSMIINDDGTKIIHPPELKRFGVRKFYGSLEKHHKEVLSIGSDLRRRDVEIETQIEYDRIKHVFIGDTNVHFDVVMDKHGNPWQLDDWMFKEAHAAMKPMRSSRPSKISWDTKRITDEQSRKIIGQAFHAWERANKPGYTGRYTDTITSEEPRGDIKQRLESLRNEYIDNTRDTLDSDEIYEDELEDWSLIEDNFGVSWPVIVWESFGPWLKQNGQEKLAAASMLVER